MCWKVGHAVVRLLDSIACETIRILRHIMTLQSSLATASNRNFLKAVRSSGLTSHHISRALVPRLPLILSVGVFTGNRECMQMSLRRMQWGVGKWTVQSQLCYTTFFENANLFQCHWCIQEQLELSFALAYVRWTQKSVLSWTKQCKNTQMCSPLSAFSRKPHVFFFLHEFAQHDIFEEHIYYL